MTAAIDPGDAFVLSVGIERYDYGGGMDLPGAASDAERFAEWALGCGVPPAQVRLACAWLDERSAKQFEGVESVGTTRHELEDAIVDLRSGELLLVYWCGHGLLNDQGERALFTSDATARNKRNVLVDELLAYLSSDRVGFGRQILLIDACANFVEDMRFDEELPRATLPKGDPREVAQFAYFAAAQGQIADFNRTERSARFSHSALTWLEQNAAATLPPDVSLLTRDVDEIFERLVEAGELRQTPVYRRVRHYAGSEDVLEIAGGAPVTGFAQAAVRDAGMTVSQALRVAEAVAVVPMLATRAGRAQLSAALGESGAARDVDLIDLVARVLGEGRGTQLFDALRAQAATDREQLAVRQADDCWRRQEWIAPALRCFTTVNARQVREAYYRAVPNTDKFAPRDLDDAMDHAAAYGQRRDAEAPLYRLVARLECETGTRVPGDWYELPADRLNALRDGAAAPMESARLVLDLRAADGRSDSWPATVVGHLHSGAKGWSRRTEDCEPTIEGAQDAVARLIDWAYVQGIASFTLGLIVPRSAFDSIPESWACGDDLEDPTPLWDEHPTVLHCAERLSTPKARARWLEKAAAIKARLANAAPDLVWIEADQRDDPAGIRASVRKATGSCYGLAFAPGEFCRDLRRDPIVQTVAGGAPYVVWAGGEPSDWGETRQRLLELVAEGAFEELPARLHHARSVAGDGLGHAVRLVWDEPEFLPPLGPLAGIVPVGGQDG